MKSLQKQHKIKFFSIFLWLFSVFATFQTYAQNPKINDLVMINFVNMCKRMIRPYRFKK